MRVRETRERRSKESGAQIDVFSDFNGIPQGVDKAEFYQHEQNWSNRMILGDSLQVMASLAERRGSSERPNPKRKLLSSANPAGIVVLMPYTVTDKGVFAVCKTAPIALPPPRPPSPPLPG